MSFSNSALSHPTPRTTPQSQSTWTGLCQSLYFPRHAVHLFRSLTHHEALIRPFIFRFRPRSCAFDTLSGLVSVRGSHRESKTVPLIHIRVIDAEHGKGRRTYVQHEPTNICHNRRFISGYWCLMDAGRKCGDCGTSGSTSSVSYGNDGSCKRRTSSCHGRGDAALYSALPGLPCALYSTD